MRRPNRQLNIFNMSAIDLFASAMGAFVLIAVILFPYYLKRGGASGDKDASKLLDSANQKIALLEIDLKRAQEDAMEARRDEESTEDALKPKDIEVVFVCDTTGSMGSHLDGIKKNLRDVVDILRLVNKKIRIGFVAYKDEVEAGHAGSYVTKAFQIREMNSGGFDELNAFVDSLEAFVVANEDMAESLSIAIEESIQMNWENEGKRIIVCITDAPAKLQQKAFSQASSFAGSSSQKVSKRLSAILAKTDNMDPRAPAFLQELTRRGEGDYIEDSGRMLNSLIRATLGD